MSEADVSLMRWAILSAPKNRAAEAEVALDSLTAALERAEQERDEAQGLLNDIRDDDDDERDRRHAAEARAQKAEADVEKCIEISEGFRHRLLRAEAVVEAARNCRLWRTIRHEDVRALDAALTAYDEPPTAEPDFWRPTGECPEC